MKLFDGGHTIDVNGAPASDGGSPLVTVKIYDEGATVNVVADHPPPVSGPRRYRSEQPYLLQHVDRAREPDRIHKPGSTDLILDGTGQGAGFRCQAVQGKSSVADHLDFRIGWAFDSKGKGGDYIDSLQHRNPATPVHWLTVPLNGVTSGARQYTVDATAALRFIQQQDCYNAWSFNRSGAIRAIAGSQSATPPRFDVFYEDGSTQTLACRVTAVMDGATDYPFTILNQAGLPQFNLPVIAEFERPTKAIGSAVFVFTIATHTSAAATFTGNILDPPLNTDPVTYGAAWNVGPLDEGLDKVAGVIQSHRYVDGAPESDFIFYTPAVSASKYNPDNEVNFSPDMIWPEHTGNPVPGPYVPDLTKFPHSTSPIGGKHKWQGIGIGQAEQFHIVPSTYAEEGFVPLAPGLGALRTHLPPLPGIQDGTIETSASWQTIQARIWFPADMWGADDIYTRFYFRLGTPQRGQAGPLGPPDDPYRMPMEERYQVFNSSGRWIFTDCAGKSGISPDQVTGYGGFSATAGGGSGIQLRHSFNDFSSATSGPDVGGEARGWHLYDFSRNPPGYSYNGDVGNLTQFGQRGGLAGVFYGNVWYEIETRAKLNSVRDAAGNVIPKLPENQNRGGFLPDGELHVWVDGRLVFKRTGMVFRSLPYSYGWATAAQGGYDARPLTDPGYNKSLRRQCKDIGLIGQLLNEYHGGVTQNNVHRTRFYTLLAYGKTRIGPTRMP